MIDVEDSIVINRPIGEVFAFVADQTNAPRWQNGLEQVRRTTDGPPGVGTKHVVVRKFLGRRLELIKRIRPLRAERGDRLHRCVRARPLRGDVPDRGDRRGNPGELPHADGAEGAVRPR